MTQPPLPYKKLAHTPVAIEWMLYLLAIAILAPMQTGDVSVIV